jgi:hypothetical protein
MNLLSAFRATPSDDLAAQRRRRALKIARETLTELQLADLTFDKFGIVRHVGERYKLVRGVVDEPVASSATAFYVSEAGDATYLEELK